MIISEIPVLFMSFLPSSFIVDQQLTLVTTWLMSKTARYKYIFSMLIVSCKSKDTTLLVFCEGTWWKCDDDDVQEVKNKRMITINEDWFG